MYRQQRKKIESPPEPTEKQLWRDSPYIVWTGGSQETPVVRFHAKGAVTIDETMHKVGEHYHLSYKISKYASPLIRHILSGHGFHEAIYPSGSFNLMWTGHCVTSSVFQNLKGYQKINHFPNSQQLGRKDLLCQNIKRMQNKYMTKIFDFMPMSYVLPEEYLDFSKAFSKNQGLWITKPVNSSQGKGIKVFRSLDEVDIKDNVLVSQYISNPFLVDGYKFDFRLYVLVTSYNPLIIYLYKDGLTRFATEKYSPTDANMKNKFMHLTNTSVNMNSHKYRINRDQEVENQGSLWTFSAMLRYLKELGKDTDAIMTKIEDVIIKTLISVEERIAAACETNVPHENNCFELYGFDIMLDENMKPWLLEVNQSPALTSASPVEFKVKANLMADTLTLVGVECQDTRLKNEMQIPSKGHCRNYRKIVQDAKDADERKGGFVRVFPRRGIVDVYGPISQCRSANYALSSGLFGFLHEHSTDPEVIKTESRQNTVKYERTLAPLPKILRTVQPTPPKTRNLSPVKKYISDTTKQPVVKKAEKLPPLINSQNGKQKQQVAPREPRPPLTPKDTKSAPRQQAQVYTNMEKNRVPAASKDTVVNKLPPLQKEAYSKRGQDTVRCERTQAPVLRNQALHGGMQRYTVIPTKTSQMREQRAAQMKLDIISQEKKASQALQRRRPVGPVPRIL